MRLLVTIVGIKDESINNLVTMKLNLGLEIHSDISASYWYCQSRWNANLKQTESVSGTQINSMYKQTIQSQLHQFQTHLHITQRLGNHGDQFIYERDRGKHFEDMSAIVAYSCLYYTLC